MPGARSEGQIMIGCWCEAALVEKIDCARGSRTRSQFCREAIAEKLRALGMQVPERETASPDRAGKGGRRRTIYPMPQHKVELNEPGPAAAAAGKRPSKKPLKAKLRVK
jgi:hypothetical protein